MFERPVVDPRCVLVSLDVGGVDAAAHLEFEELACSAGAEIVGTLTARRDDVGVVFWESFIPQSWERALHEAAARLDANLRAPFRAWG